MTLFFLALEKASGADGILSPPGFLFPVKEQVACMKRPNEGPIKGPFFIDKSLLSDKGLYKPKEILYNVTVLHT